MNKTFQRLTYLLSAIVFLAACEHKAYQSVPELDEQNIQSYIAKNGLSVEEFKNTGIYYQVLDAGTGAVLDYEKKYPIITTVQSLDRSFISQDTFTVAYPVNNRYYNYLGYFSPLAVRTALSDDQDIKALLKEKLIRANGKIQVIIPSRLAFGTEGYRNPKIPSNASLDCTIHVVDPNDFAAYEDESIQSYADNQDLTLTEFTKTESGVYYKVVEAGTGDAVTLDKRIQVNYTLRLFDGSEYETRDSTTFDLRNVIPAWQEVMPKFKEQAIVRLLIPSAQAYGMDAAYNSVTGALLRPPFTALDYEVKILNADIDKEEDGD